MVREMTRACEVVGLNPCTVYWMDMTLFTLICVNNSIVCLKRSKINKKDAGVGPFKKTIDTITIHFRVYQLCEKQSVKCKQDSKVLTYS